MSWWNPFKKKEAATVEADKPAAGAEKKPAGADKGLPIPELPPELAKDPKAKGAMALFYRKWKDPAFLKQLRALAAHMQKDGVDMKDMKAVQAWLEKNKELVSSGKLQEPPQAGKAETFVKSGPDVGRNDPCPCGSGKKYKKCCGSKASA